MPDDVLSERSSTVRSIQVPPPSLRASKLFSSFSRPSTPSPSQCLLYDGDFRGTSVILCWRKDSAVGEMRRRRIWGIVWWLDARGLGCMFRGCPSSIWVAERDYRSTFTGDDDVRPDVASPVYGSCHVRPVSSQTLWRAQGCWVRRPS